MTILYHATSQTAAKSILRQGLTLPIGRVTSGCRLDPRIYLYKSKRDAELHVPALYELGCLPYRLSFAVLEVNLPADYTLYGDPEYSGSVFVKRNIPAKCVKQISAHDSDYSEFDNIDWDK